MMPLFLVRMFWGGHGEFNIYISIDVEFKHLCVHMLVHVMESQTNEENV